MPALIECVPNFSEGRDPEVIRRIAACLESVEGAKLLHVDAGKATNRTVMTLAGTPEAVVEAAFRAIAEAAELIDMRRHTGEHARMGATDVCPLVPISDISMRETADWARKLAARVGHELKIPVYAYEAAQPDPARRPRGHPGRRVRGAGAEDEGAGVDAGFRPGHLQRPERRHRHRRP